MRTYLKAVSFALAVLMTATVAWGYPVPQEFKMKFANAETFNPQVVPGAGPFGDGIEDNWGIANITQIFDLNNGPLSPAVWNEGQNGEHLRLVFWGLDVIAWPSNPGGFTTGAANQTIGGLAIPYAGMAMYLWNDSNPGYLPFVDAGPAARIGFDGYQTISDGGTLQGLFQFAPGIVNNPNVLTNGNTFLNALPPTGQGSGYFDSILGSGDFADIVNTDSFITSQGNRDLFFQFNFRAPGIADPPTTFALYSEDPMLGVANVPEPGTIILLGVGLLAVAGFARRRTEQ